MEAVALSKVLIMCHWPRRPLLPSFRKLSEQSHCFLCYYKNSFMTEFVLAMSQEANMSPPYSRPLFKFLHAPKMQHFI